MQHLLAKVAKGQKTSKDLTWEEAKQAMRLMIEGTATPAQIGAFLTAMRFKSESVTELAAFTATARQYVPPVPVRSGLGVVDVPVYAGKRETFHAILPAAIVAAAAGAVLLLHGVDGPPDRQGISSVLKLLGIPVDMTAKSVGAELEKKGFAYLDLALYHPPVSRFLEMRQELGVRNFFHPVARMLNPARATSQVIGLSHPPYFEKTIEALAYVELSACVGDSRGRRGSGTLDRQFHAALGTQGRAHHSIYIPAEGCGLVDGDLPGNGRVPGRAAGAGGRSDQAAPRQRNSGRATGLGPPQCGHVALCRRQGDVDYWKSWGRQKRVGVRSGQGQTG
jgi:anthranilate phosphoribosyltransferase